MIVKDAIILTAIILVVLIIVFLYGTIIWATNRIKGARCPRCGVRGFYKKDELLGEICGNCERIKALRAKPEDDFDLKLKEIREKVPLHPNPRLDDYPFKASKDHPSVKIEPTEAERRMMAHGYKSPDEIVAGFDKHPSYRL